MQIQSCAYRKNSLRHVSSGHASACTLSAVVVQASKPCRRQGCPNLVPCPEHPIGPWSTSRRDQQISRRSGSRTQMRNRWILGLSSVCHVCGLGGATEVDHVVPLALGGADKLDNLKAIHHDCHTAKTAKEAIQGRQRRSAQ